jgi:preprotein translocase subunit SecE
MKISILVNYFKGVWSELKKVSWPTRKEVINHTIIVLVSAAIAIALISVVDFGLSKLIEYLVQNRG